MKSLPALEELGQFLLSVWLFTLLDLAWWLYPACLLLPDMSMVGYAVNPAVGARVYNLVHHKLLAVAVLITGFWLEVPYLAFAGVILFGHAAMDRLFGYGLKHSDDFRHTHLGWIGRKGS